VFIMTKFA